MTTSTPQAFLRFALAAQALRFGQFQTKAGRMSPYFFNAGQFNRGDLLSGLGQYYARTIVEADLSYDMLFGPAYKGIPLVVAVGIALARDHGRSVPIAFNRKEVKDHGEGGGLIGSPLAGRVLVVDDVVSAGTSVGESVALIRAAGAQLAGVVIALDRQERGQGASNAVQEIQDQHGVPVTAIACLDDVVQLLADDPAQAEHLTRIQAYRQQYGC